MSEQVENPKQREVLELHQTALVALVSCIGQMADHLERLDKRWHPPMSFTLAHAFLTFLALFLALR